MRSVAFLVAASPTPAFYSQVAALNRRLRSFAWSHWRPSLHVFLGGDRRGDPFLAWQPYLEDVEICWTSDARFSREGDWAQSDDAFRCAPRDADVLVAIDADTFPITPFEPLLDRVSDTGSVAGVIAHYPAALASPLEASPRDRSVCGDAARTAGSQREAWAHLSAGLLDVPLDFAYLHTLMGPEQPLDRRLTPFYLNFGVVLFPKPAFDLVAPRYLALRPPVMERMTCGDFSGQVALTLAIADARVRTWALPMRYNFPNDPLAERLYPGELENVSVVHYLRTDCFDRHRIFATEDAYAAFLDLPLTGANRRFRDAVVETFGTGYPFPTDAGAGWRHT